MARAIMIQGTGPNIGKSLVVAGLARGWLRDLGAGPDLLRETTLDNARDALARHLETVMDMERVLSLAAAPADQSNS